MFRFVVLIALLACGVADVVQLDGRIVGGTDTTIEAHPHQVSLRISGSHFCAGSIYKANFIVTAAHCLTGVSASRITVVAGTSSRTGADTSRKVSKIIVNPSYHSATINQDIALLKLSSEFTFTPSIQPIGLAASVPAVGSAVITTGWGNTSEGGSSASILQEVVVNVVSNANCSSAYGSGFITCAMMCAGVVAGGKDACQGDAGGPLIHNGELVGVVSWGYGCGRKGYPGVYGNVPAHKRWIEDNTL